MCVSLCSNIDEKYFEKILKHPLPFDNCEYELRISGTVSTDRRIMSFIDTLWCFEVTGGADQFEPLVIIDVRLNEIELSADQTVFSMFCFNGMANGYLTKVATNQKANCGIRGMNERQMPIGREAKIQNLEELSLIGLKSVVVIASLISNISIKSYLNAFTSSALGETKWFGLQSGNSSERHHFPNQQCVHGRSDIARSLSINPQIW